MTKFIHIAIGEYLYSNLKEFLKNSVDNIFTGDIRLMKDKLSLDELKMLESTYIKELDMDRGYKVIIWCNNDEKEKMELMFLINRLKNNDIFTVNTSKISKGDMSKIERCLDDFSIISSVEKSDLISRWNKIKNSNK